MNDEYWSGCNYWINQGANEWEPIGTATSMHECGDCDCLTICKLKKECDVWELNDEIRKQTHGDFVEMKRGTQTQ